MTKSEALKLFRELKLKKLDAFWWPKYDIVPTNPSRDKVALREAWNNFTDFLCKDRQITAKQYDTWSNPF